MSQHVETIAQRPAFTMNESGIIPSDGAAITAAAADAPQRYASGVLVADRFLLIHELGVGGMSSVWLARDVRLDTDCALKLTRIDLLERQDICARVEREAKAVAQLRSAHVVQVLDYGLWEGIPYIAMELLAGETLEDRLNRCGRLDPEQTIQLITQIARALSKAHAAGLIHRDLTPKNVFLVREDDREIAKVLDFGIVKAQLPTSLSDVTQVGVLVGTPLYVSPEQAQGLPRIDYRSDLWSLAVIAFRCVTGKLPFFSEALGELLVQIIVGDLPKPSLVADGVPPAFDAWWTRAAGRDPMRRFQSAKQLADTLAFALRVGSEPPISTTLVSSVSPPGRSRISQPLIEVRSRGTACDGSRDGGRESPIPVLPVLELIRTAAPEAAAPPSRPRLTRAALDISLAVGVLVITALLALWGSALIDRFLAARFGGVEGPALRATMSERAAPERAQGHPLSPPVPR